MKRTLLTILFLLALAVSAFGADVKLSWDANPAAELVTKYTVYMATAAVGPFGKVADVPSGTTYTITGLAVGSYFFRITATNLWGESPPSAVVAAPPVATAPKNTIIVTITVP